jgi:hypothetical protein
MAVGWPIVPDLGTDFIRVRSSSATVFEALPRGILGGPILSSDESFSWQEMEEIMPADETTAIDQDLELMRPLEHGTTTNLEDGTLVPH